jgi:hypothetical protein
MAAFIASVCWYALIAPIKRSGVGCCGGIAVAIPFSPGCQNLNILGHFLSGHIIFFNQVDFAYAVRKIHRRFQILASAMMEGKSSLGGV